MAGDATNPETLRRLAEETRRLRESVASVSFAWANVENVMVMLLYAILRDDQGRFSSAIYFAPSAIETRFRIVDKAIIELADSTCCEKEIITSWGNVLSKLNALKEKRNKIAHGQISTMGSHGSKNYVRFVIGNPGDQALRDQQQGAGDRYIKCCYRAHSRLSLFQRQRQRAEIGERVLRGGVLPVSLGWQGNQGQQRCPSDGLHGLPSSDARD